MAKLGISTGTVPNDGTGDSLLAAGVKINNNFDEVYSLLGDGTNLSSGIVTSIVAGVGITLSGSSGSVTVTVEPSIVSAGGTWDSSSSVGIYTSKSVGIGTTNPLEKLTVGGNVFATELIGIGTRPTFPLHIRSNPGSAEPSIVVSPFSTARPAAIRLTNGSESNFILGLQNSSGNGDLLAFPAYSGVVGLSSNNPLIFVTNGIEGFRLSESGNLGLNRNAPSSKLDVFGDARISGVVTAASFVGSGVGLTGVSANYTNLAGISTSVIGGISSVSSLTVSGVSTFNGGTYYNSSVYHSDNPTRAYFGSLNEMSIYSTGTFIGTSFNYIDASSGYLDIRNLRTTIRNPETTTQRDLAVFDANTFNAEFVKLYYGGNEKIATIGAGVTVTGTTFTNQLSISGVSTLGQGLNVPSNYGITMGADGSPTTGEIRIYNGVSPTDYFQIFASGNESYIRNTGAYGQGVNINATGSVALGGGGSGGYSVLAESDGSAILALSSVQKLRTLGAGVTVSGTTFTNQLSVSGVSTLNQASISNATISGVATVGVLTATSLYGDASYTVSGKWTVTGDGYNFTFVGIGLSVPTNDPVLYFARGCTYHIVNNDGDHPLEIRDQANGFAYNNGVVGNGQTMTTVKFTVPLDAPNTLYYQCTDHAGMGNTIRIYPDRI